VISQNVGIHAATSFDFFSIVPLVLCSRVLRHTQLTTEKEKEQSEFTNNEVWLCQLLFDACSKKTTGYKLVSNPTAGFLLDFVTLISLETSMEITRKFYN